MTIKASITSFILSLSILFFVSQNTVLAARSSPLIVDHSAVSAFSNLTDAQINSAKNTRLIFEHASVGGNISDGLNSLQSRESKYSRTNWVFYNRGNPGARSKINDFVSRVPSYVSSYSALSMKYCYIDTDANFQTYRDAMNSLEQSHPTKTFIWWTMPIETTSNTTRNNFNSQVRAYASSNNKVLFDIADIESNGSRTNEAMVQSYSSDGGHLNATGSDRVAKAFWWMMASLATTPNPTGKPGDADGDDRVDGVDYSIWHNNYTKQVTNGPRGGDFDNSGIVNGVDYSIWHNNYSK